MRNNDGDSMNCETGEILREVGILFSKGFCHIKRDRNWLDASISTHLSNDITINNHKHAATLSHLSSVSTDTRLSSIVGSQKTVQFDWFKCVRKRFQTTAGSGTNRWSKFYVSKS